MADAGTEPTRKAPEHAEEDQAAAQAPGIHRPDQTLGETHRSADLSFTADTRARARLPHPRSLSGSRPTPPTPACRVSDHSPPPDTHYRSPESSRSARRCSHRSPP